ncbi:hypothetical protein SUGI_0360260 [Cryptomeria japonica]|nr:hypothetical protein SUGI_0360260 [Cryptomeria japonica]
MARIGNGEANQYSFHNTLPEKTIGDLKELLFQNDVSVVGVHCMGGGRKTTLALALCDDPHIKGCFRNIVFITVSQSPNLKGILETIWEKIFGRNVPEFQNVEDAHIQLQQRLLKQSKPTLTSIPITADANLVIEVQAECKGLPLALKVVGSSLYGEPHVAWENAKQKLSLGESISPYHSEGLFRRLETSIDCLDDVWRECFLDFASYPEDKKSCADALLNIWVYVRKMEWQDAYTILLELARRNLLNLISNQGTQSTISYGCASELFFSQHDVMRDLALYLGCQDSIVHTKRLLMPRKEHCLPGEWELLRDRLFNAQIVSIHTGSMAENEWYSMKLAETEALVLHFSASEYFLPPFLKTMKKLKVLIVCNLGSERATIKGLDALSSLPQLRSVRLERLVAPKHIKAIQNLDKLSLSLCEGFVNMSTFNYSNVHEFSLDHCSDLEELPPALCHMPSVQTWSVTNCHLVENLPYNLENMCSLRMLRLSALPGLKELPASIGQLGQLEFLDISLCEGLEKLPEEIGELKKLKEFDMRECYHLRRLPRSVCGLNSLKHVSCNENIGDKWLRAKSCSIPDLRVEIVEAQFTFLTLTF